MASKYHVLKRSSVGIDPVAYCGRKAGPRGVKAMMPEWFFNHEKPAEIEPHICANCRRQAF